MKFHKNPLIDSRVIRADRNIRNAKIWRKEICKQWLYISEEAVYRKTLSCYQVILKNMGTFLYRV
jgi:hypothetical protein